METIMKKEEKRNLLSGSVISIGQKRKGIRIQSAKDLLVVALSDLQMNWTYESTAQIYHLMC
jgi:hypothetical protein